MHQRRAHLRMKLGGLVCGRGVLQHPSGPHGRYCGSGFCVREQAWHRTCHRGPKSLPPTAHRHRPPPERPAATGTTRTTSATRGKREPPIRAARNQRHHSNRNQTSPRAIRWIQAYTLSTRGNPLSASSRSRLGSCPSCSLGSAVSSVTSGVTFTTESRGESVVPIGRNTLPGIIATAVFDVTAATNSVANRLSLEESD